MKTSYATPARVTKRPPASRRSFEKCNYCRGKKCKCLPPNRNWAAGEKCVACERGGQPCGPNERYDERQVDVSGTSPQPPLAVNTPGGASSVFSQHAGQENFNRRLLHQPSQLSLEYAHLPAAINETSGSSTQTAAVGVDAIDSVPDVENVLAQFMDDEEMNLGGFDSSCNGHHEAFIRARTGELSPISLNSLKRLGSLHVLYEYLHDWRKAFPCGFKTLDKGDICQQLGQSVELATWAVETAFRDTLTRLVESVQECGSSRKELVLRRALKAIERFEGIAKHPGLVNESNKIYSTILQQLIAIAQAEDDIAEIAILRAELHKLDSLQEGCSDAGKNKSLAESLKSSARLACEMLQELNMPAAVRTTLKLTRRTTLPTAHRAMHAGFQEAARVLSEQNDSEPVLPEILGRSILHIAVETGSLKILPFLLEQTPGFLNSRDTLMRTPLLIAASKGDLPAFDKLVAAGADIRARDMASRSVLNHACAAGNFTMVETLLREGAEVNDDTLGASSPLCEAASRGHYDICLLLLEHGDCADHLDMAAELAEKNGHHPVATLLQQNALLHSSGGLTLMREGMSSGSTPLYNFPNHFFDSAVQDWDTGTNLDVSSESSHASTSERMSETFDSGFGPPASNSFGSKC